MFSDSKGPFVGEPGRARLFGVYPAIVVEVTDPDAQGRVKIRLPWLDADEGGQATAWARLATLMAGADRGTWFIPEPDDEVLVAFFMGDPRHPVVVGAMWNGQDAPPEEMDGAGQNNIRSITSRCGHVLTFDDTQGAEKVEIRTNLGHVVTLDDASGGTITIEHVGGAKIEMDVAGKIAITAVSECTVDAPAGMKVTAPMLTADVPFSKFSGVIKCETLITQSVVSPLYTPGAGNIL